MVDFDGLLDLRTKIIERYTLYELLELCEIDTEEFLDIWDGWVDNFVILDDLGLLTDEEEDDEN